MPHKDTTTAKVKTEAYNGDFILGGHFYSPDNRKCSSVAFCNWAATAATSAMHRLAIRTKSSTLQAALNDRNWTLTAALSPT
jgi:hypothetical protein